MIDTSVEQLQQWIRAAAHQEPVDLVIRNGRIVDVFNLDIIEGDVAIHQGRIVGIGQYEGVQVIDAAGRYIAPSFMDAHVHIESSMVTPREFARAVLPHGITTVVTDPHEIGNVCGTAGIQFMLDASEQLPLDVFVMLPSCVPSTPFENAGAVLNATSLEPFYAHPRVIGLAEVMDYPSVANAVPDMIHKLHGAAKHGGRIDGHGAGLSGDAINIYRTAGIETDHECVNAAEALERLRKGMYLMIREGSVAKDLHALIGVVNERNARRCIFCTDDKHLDELITEGSVDHNVRLAIQAGLDPLLAITMASLNVAECYGFQHKGAIAPGYDADLLLIDDLQQISIAQVYKKGQLVAEHGQYVGAEMPRYTPPAEVLHTVHLPDITADHLRIELGGHRRCHIIGINPNSLVTTHITDEVEVDEQGCFLPSVAKDQLKMVLLERHHLTGNIGLGIVHGFGIASGAIASTVAHDSHNLAVVGTNDEDMLLAIRTLAEINGGLVIVQHGQVVCSIPLGIAGLLSEASYDDVNQQLSKLNEGLTSIGAAQHFNPFVTLSFLCLPVIPALKLTDLGLFDFESFRHISIIAD